MPGCRIMHLVGLHHKTGTRSFVILPTDCRSADNRQGMENGDSVAFFFAIMLPTGSLTFLPSNVSSLVCCGRCLPAISSHLFLAPPSPAAAAAEQHWAQIAASALTWTYCCSVLHFVSETSIISKINLMNTASTDQHLFLFCRRCCLSSTIAV